MDTNKFSELGRNDCRDLINKTINFYKKDLNTKDIMESDAKICRYLEFLCIHKHLMDSSGEVSSYTTLLKYSTFNKIKNGSLEIGIPRFHRILNLLDTFNKKYLGCTINPDYSNDISMDQLFIKIGPKNPLPEFSTKINPKNIKQFGLTDIQSSEPVEKIKEELQSATTFRLLISRIRSPEVWIPIFRDFAQREDTEEIQLLLGQPHSESILLREKALESDSAIYDFSSLIFNLLKRIAKLKSQYPALQKKLNVRLFTMPCSISIYQCLDKTEIISTHFGVFWNHQSSLNAPHFEVKGISSLSQDIADHFTATWEGKNFSYTEKENLVDWRSVFRRGQTIDSPSSLSQVIKLEKLILEWTSFKRFMNPIIVNPVLIFFKGFYFRDEQLESFRLVIDIENKIVKLDHSRSKKDFTGIYYELQNSIQIQMTTVKKPHRVALFQIPIGINTLEEKNFLTGLYSNAKTFSGILYSKFFILKKINDTEESYTNCKISKQLQGFLKWNRLVLEEEIQKYAEDLYHDTNHNIVNEKHHSKHLFNSSCYLASKNHTSLAIQTLKNAFEAGFNDRELLKDEVKNGALQSIKQHIDLVTLQIA